MKILSPKMRDINQLLKSEAGCDRISDYNFRSTDEVSAYIAGLGAQITAITAKLTKATRFGTRASTRVDAINVDLGQLKASYELLGELQTKLEILQSLEVTIAHNFRNNREKLSKEINTLAARIGRERDKALNVLERMAANREPVPFATMVDKQVRALKAALKRRYSALKEYSYVISGHNPGSLVFNHYVKFTDLVNDHQEFVYQEYYLVFSAVVVGQQMRTYVTTLHEFRAPGAFNIGTEFANDQQLAEAINTLMLADQFMDAEDQPLLSLRTGDVRLNKLLIKNVESVEIADNKLRLLIGPTDPADVSKMVKSLCRDVTAILVPAGIKGVLKYKLRTSGKRHVLEFIVVPSTRITLDASQERLLRDRLGMNASQIQSVRKLMDKGYV